MVAKRYGGVWWIFGLLSSGIFGEVFGVITSGFPSRNVDSVQTDGTRIHNFVSNNLDETHVTVGVADQNVNNNVSDMATHGSTVTPKIGAGVVMETSPSASLARSLRRYSLPKIWSEFCEVFDNETYKSEFSTRTNLTLIRCVVGVDHSGVLAMTDLRDNILQHMDLDLNFSVEIRCDSMANISFSWPFKVSNLFKLKIQDCTILDFLGERGSEYLVSTPDSLRVIHIWNSITLVKLSRLADATSSIKSVQKEFDCLHETTIEDMSNRNVTFDFIMDDEYILTQLIQRGVQYIQDTRRISHDCDYKHLLSVDESVSQHRALYHTDLMTDNSFYDELRTYNVSNTYINVLKDQYLQWSRKFPKLEMLDLSHNNISKLYRFAVPLRTNLDIITTVDLRYNQISSISVSDLDLFKTMPMVFYDLRNNSVDCNCSDTLVELVRYINDGKHLLISNLSDYSYLEDLLCANPKKFTGVALKSLTNGMICESTVQTEYFIVPIICLSAAIIILAVLLIMVLKFRQEIVIILFTRFNIIIPCQSRENYDSGKKYDAFVSYSSNEEDYVEKMFEDLEKQPDDNSRPGFKFCMHHRDFVPGRTIFDNVTYSVESSRHTIILLSNHFIKSEFCLYEFQEAFRQSIMEKRRHLLIIMMDDIPEEKLPRDLRRCVKTFTYIRKDDFLFTERLVYALSIKHKGKTVTVDSSKAKNSTENKLQKDCKTNKLSTSGENAMNKTTSKNDKPETVAFETNCITESDIKPVRCESDALNDSVKFTKFEQKPQKYKKKVFGQNGDKLTISIKHVNDYNLSPIERKLNNKDLEYDRSLSTISQDTGYGSERGSICERLSPEVAVDIEEFPSNAVIC